jgi:hypothetical protein
MVSSPKGLGPEKDCPGKNNSIYKRETRPLVTEGAPQKQDRNCQIGLNIWSWAPYGALHQDLLTDWLTDWPSVAMWPWLRPRQLLVVSWQRVSWTSACEEKTRRLVWNGRQPSSCQMRQEFCKGDYEDRTWGRETEKSPLLEAFVRERLVKTYQAGKCLMNAVVICKVWRLAVAL